MFGGFREREDYHSWKARKEGMRQKRLFLISLARMFFLLGRYELKPKLITFIFQMSGSTTQLSSFD